MDTDKLIDQIHAANAQRRSTEHRRPHRTVWRIAIPATAAAAVLLVLLLPRGNAAQAAPAVAGVYCNSQCNPDDVMALIDNQINHIKTLQIS